MVGLRPDRELAGGVFGPGACAAGWTGATGGPVKADAHDGITGAIPPWGPFHTGLALGTAGLFRFPLDHEGASVIALAREALPAVGAKGRADHVDLMVGLGGDEEVRIDVAAVQQVGAGEATAIG